jgi:hypothetical protein
LHFFEDGFETFFELAAKFRSGNQRAHVERNYFLIFESFGNIAADNPLRESFDDRGLAHARFTNQHRIIFRTAGEHRYHAANFVVAADHRIEFSRGRELGQITAIFFQRLIGRFRILRGDSLAAANFLQRFHETFARQPEILEGFFLGSREENMFDGNVLVFEPLRFAFRVRQKRLKAGGNVDLIDAGCCAGDARQLVEILHQAAMQNLRINSCFQ